MKNLLVVVFACLLVFPISALAQNPGKNAYIAAEKLRKSNRYKEAIQKYDAAISAESDNYKYYFHRGKCEYKLKLYDDAKTSFERTVEYNKAFTPAHSLLAKLATKGKDYDQAIKHYEDAAYHERKPRRKVHYKLLLVNLLIKGDKLYEAEKHIMDAKEIDPDNPNILYYIGELHRTDGKWEDAKSAYLKALENDNIKNAAPAENAKYYYGLGVAYNNLGDNANAKKAWSKANFGPYRSLISKQMLKTNHVYYYKIAVSYYLIGEYKESNRHINKALDLQEDFSSAYILKGKIEKKQGNIGRAVEYYQDAIGYEKNPKKVAKMYALLATLQLSDNNASGAMSSIGRALEASPGNPKLLYLRAKAEMNGGRYDEAESTLEKLLTMVSDSKSKAKYNFMLGVAAKANGDTQKAVAAFKGAGYGPYKSAARFELETLSGTNKKG